MSYDLGGPMQVGGIGAYKGIMLSNRPSQLVSNTIVEPHRDSPRAKVTAASMFCNCYCSR